MSKPLSVAQREAINRELVRLRNQLEYDHKELARSHRNITYYSKQVEENTKEVKELTSLLDAVDGH